MLPILNGPATALDQLYLTLRPEPLEDPKQFATFYRPQVNKVRGPDTVVRLSLKLQQSYRALPFRAFVMGHAGVGKSTEITRLLENIKEQQVGVRLSVATELNPSSFKVYDVLLLMLARLAEETDRLKANPLEGILSHDLVRGIIEWFDSKSEKTTHTGTAGAGVEVGAGMTWATLLGFFARAKGELKYSAERKTETVQYRLQRLLDLVELCNRLIDACSKLLFAKSQREWVLIVEDLDKAVVSPQQLRELFVQYGGVFANLRISLIFTIPVWLAYSPDANQLPFAFDRYMIHDTPVYDRTHAPHKSGRAAVQTVLEARVSPALFADGEMTRLIVASGGNLRDLFALVLDAGEGARVSDPAAVVIRHDDATAAINRMRREYLMRLGESPYDKDPIQYPEKSARLVAVYHGARDSQIPDRVLYSLLRGRAVQEFNGDGWCGVHPLVVDILKRDQHLLPQDLGGTD